MLAVEYSTLFGLILISLIRFSEGVEKNHGKYLSKCKQIKEYASKKLVYKSTSISTNVV